MMDKTNPHHEYVYLANLSSLKNQLPQSDRKKANKNYDKIAQWINIEEKSLIQLIVLTFVDPDKKQILNLTAKKSLTVPEILQMYEMSKTSGYRTINSLIKSGLLVKNSIGNIKNGKKINKYRSIFEDVKIKIETNKVSVLAKFAKV
jgi:predicted transcriptional regulator